MSTESKQIELYLGEKTFLPGQRVSVFVRSARRPYTLEIVRFGDQEEVVYRGAQRKSQKQETVACAYEHGAGWVESDRLETTNLPPPVFMP